MTTASAAEMGVGVSPGNLNFILSPGGSAEGSLSVLNTGTSTAGYLVSIDNEIYVGWFDIIPSNFELQPGQERQVTVKLSVPSSIREDADCKIELLQTSYTNVLAGVRVPVHIEVVTPNEPFSGESSGVSSGGSSGSGSSGSGSSGGSEDVSQELQSNATTGKNEASKPIDEAVDTGEAGFSGEQDGTFNESEDEGKNDFEGENKSENENVTGEVPGFASSFAGIVLAVAAFLVRRRIFE